MEDSGDGYWLDCPKCRQWYKASCYWRREYDRLTFVHRDAGGNETERVTSMFPRIIISNIEPHECVRGKQKYNV